MSLTRGEVYLKAVLDAFKIALLYGEESKKSSKKKKKEKKKK